MKKLATILLLLVVSFFLFASTAGSYTIFLISVVEPEAPRYYTKSYTNNDNVFGFGDEVVVSQHDAEAVIDFFSVPSECSRGTVSIDLLASGLIHDNIPLSAPVIEANLFANGNVNTAGNRCTFTLNCSDVSTFIGSVRFRYNKNDLTSPGEYKSFISISYTFN